MAEVPASTRRLLTRSSLSARGEHARQNRQGLSTTLNLNAICRHASPHLLLGDLAFGDLIEFGTAEYVQLKHVGMLTVGNAETFAKLFAD